MPHKNKNDRRLYKSAWRRASPVKDKAIAKTYRDSHRDEIRARNTAYREAHSEKVANGGRAWRASNRERVRSSARQRRYKLSPEAFEAMLEEQNHKCWFSACTTRHTSIKPLVVDHDHGTGEVRGLLCHGHNVSLGKFGDNVSGVEEVLRYLLKSQTKPPDPGVATSTNPDWVLSWFND